MEIKRVYLHDLCLFQLFYLLVVIHFGYQTRRIELYGLGKLLPLKAKKVELILDLKKLDPAVSGLDGVVAYKEFMHQLLALVQSVTLEKFKITNEGPLLEIGIVKEIDTLLKVVGFDGNRVNHLLDLGVAST